MVSSKTIPKSICIFLSFTFLLLMFDIGLAEESEVLREVEMFSPDPYEYQSVTEEESFDFQYLENEYGLSITLEEIPIEGDSFQQAGSSVYFCSEADCSTVQVNFAGQTHTSFLHCYNALYFSGIPEGTYHYSAIGCNEFWTKGDYYVDGHSDYFVVLCPSTLDCCPEGCGSGGVFYCGKCQASPSTSTTPTSTTTSVMQQTTTTTTPPSPVTTTTPPGTTTTTTVVPSTTTAPRLTTTTTTVQPVPDMFSISGKVSGDVINISIALSGTASMTIKTNVVTGEYEFFDLASGYYTITPIMDGYSFIPTNYEIQNLNTDLYNMDFVSTQLEPVSPCALELIYDEDSEEVKILRYIRDNVLSQTLTGKEIIRLYYEWSPAIVKAMEEDEEFKEDVREMIDGVLGLVGGEAE